MTREQVAEKVAWIIAAMAAEYHGRTIEPAEVFPSDTLVTHGIDDHLALFEFSCLAEKALGIAVSDELLDLNCDATVSTLVDQVAKELGEEEIKFSCAVEPREWAPSGARPHIVVRREQSPSRLGLTTRLPKSMRGNGGLRAPMPPRKHTPARVGAAIGAILRRGSTR